MKRWMKQLVVSALTYVTCYCVMLVVAYGVTGILQFGGHVLRLDDMKRLPQTGSFLVKWVGEDVALVPDLVVYGLLERTSAILLVAILMTLCVQAGTRWGLIAVGAVVPVAFELAQLSPLVESTEHAELLPLSPWIRAWAAAYAAPAFAAGVATAFWIAIGPLRADKAAGHRAGRSSPDPPTNGSGVSSQDGMS